MEKCNICKQEVADLAKHNRYWGYMVCEAQFQKRGWFRRLVNWFTDRHPLSY